MPKRDGTGPAGKGPMTGKGGGSCIVALNTPKEELAYLKIRKEALQLELEKTKNRISKLRLIRGDR